MAQIVYLQGHCTSTQPTYRDTAQAHSLPTGTLHKHTVYLQGHCTSTQSTYRDTAQAHSLPTGTLHKHTVYLQGHCTSTQPTYRDTAQAHSLPTGTLHKHTALTTECACTNVCFEVPSHTKISCTDRTTAAIRTVN